MARFAVGRLVAAPFVGCVTTLRICCLLAGMASLSNATVWEGQLFSPDEDVRDKVLTGDGVVTLDDVSAVTCALRCLRGLVCSFFFYQQATRACAYSPSCSNTTTLAAAPGYQLFVNSGGPSRVPSDETAVCASGTATPLGCWRQMAGVSGLRKHVSVGPAGVWGSKGSQGMVFYRGGSYQQPDGSALTYKTIKSDDELTQLDVGSDVVWGTISNTLCYLAGITSSSLQGSGLVEVGSGFRWVSVSPQGSVWAVNTAGHLLHGPDAANGSLPVAQWDAVGDADMDWRQVDAGRAGVWALDNAQRLHYRLGTYGQDGVAGTGWRRVGGAFTSVSSGRDRVVAVDTAGHVWLRTCMGADTPSGLGWVWLGQGMAQAEVYQSGDVTAIWAAAVDELPYFYLLQ